MADFDDVRVALRTDCEACAGSAKENGGDGQSKNGNYGAAGVATGPAQAIVAKTKPKQPKAPKIKQPKKPTPAQAAELLSVAKIRKVHRSICGFVF